MTLYTQRNIRQRPRSALLSRSAESRVLIHKPRPRVLPQCGVVSHGPAAATCGPVETALREAPRHNLDQVSDFIHPTSPHAASEQSCTPHIIYTNKKERLSWVSQIICLRRTRNMERSSTGTLFVSRSFPPQTTDRIYTFVFFPRRGIGINAIASEPSRHIFAQQKSNTAERHTCSPKGSNGFHIRLVQKVRRCGRSHT